MSVRQFMVLGVTALLLALSGAPAMNEKKSKQHIQIAEIVVDPAQLDNYKFAVAEQIEAAIRLESGVQVLYSVSSKDDPSRITVFARSAYERISRSCAAARSTGSSSSCNRSSANRRTSSCGR